MLYLVGVIRELEYRVLEGNTHSLIKISQSAFNNLAMKGKIVNAIELGGKVKVVDYANYKSKILRKLIGRVPEYTVLTRMGNKYKVSDSSGRLNIINENDLRQRITGKNVSNARIRRNKEIETFGVFNSDTDDEFVDNIQNKYNKYLAKSKMLGTDTSFRYIIEGYQVKLTNYTGTSKTVVLPNFIDTICENAFKDKGITSLKLNDGIEMIGMGAFKNCNLKQIIIPENIKLLDETAFYGNKELFKGDNLDRNKVMILNKKVEEEKDITIINTLKFV